MYPFYASNSSFVLFIFVCSVLLREGTFFHRLWPCIRFRLRKSTLKSLLMCSFHAVRSCGFFILLLFVCSFKVFNRCLSFLNLVMFVCPFHAVKGCGLFIYFLSECSFLCPEKIRIFSYFCFIQIV